MSKFYKSFFNSFYLTHDSVVSSDNSAVRYVLPVLWMTPCFHKMGPVGQNKKQHYVLSSSLGGSTRGEVAVYVCRLVGDWKVSRFYWDTMYM